MTNEQIIIRGDFKRMNIKENKYIIIRQNESNVTFDFIKASDDKQLLSQIGCDENLFDLASYEIGSKKDNFKLFYPSKFPHQETDFTVILDYVSKEANEAAKSQANCYWVSVTDNKEDLSGVGGGQSNEAFKKFMSERYTKPVLSLKLVVPNKDINKKNKLIDGKKQDWQICN